MWPPEPGGDDPDVLGLDQRDLPLGGVITQAFPACTMIAHEAATRLGPGLRNRDNRFATRGTEIDGLDSASGYESTAEISETHVAGFLLGLTLEQAIADSWARREESVNRSRRVGVAPLTKENPP